MKKYYYVYIIQSIRHPSRFYSGFTQNIRDRLKSHNSGECPHTTKFKPWTLKTALAFTNKKRALEFERYLKTASGRAFAKKHL